VDPRECLAGPFKDPKRMTDGGGKRNVVDERAIPSDP
jgi:hypothetical protein